MTFKKYGDAQPIITTHPGEVELDDEETQKMLEAAELAAEQDPKYITEDGNKIELNKKSTK